MVFCIRMLNPTYILCVGIFCAGCKLRFLVLRVLNVVLLFVVFYGFVGFL